MSENKVTLYRVIKASPEKVYRAFTEALAFASWLPPFGYLATIEGMDVKVGGIFKMSFHNFTTGHAHSFSGEYVEIKPNEYLQYINKFDDPNMPGAITNSIWFEKTSVGTKLTVIQADIPAMIPAEMCYLGWQESIEKLIQLVEPNIPNG